MPRVGRANGGAAAPGAIATRALHFWVIWNQLLETVTDWSYQVETVEFDEICERAELLPDCSEGEAFNRGKGAAGIPQASQSAAKALTWEDLAAVDPNITLVAQSMAARCGYEVPDGRHRRMIDDVS